MSCLKLGAAVAACAAVTACGPRDARYNASHFVLSGPAAPPEIVLPKGVKPGSSIYGVTTTAPKDENLCCAAQAHVDAPVRKDRRASVLRVGIYTPKGFTQHLRVTFPNGTVERRGAGGGMAVLSFPVPPSLQGARGTVRIRLDASHAPYVLASLYFE